MSESRWNVQPIIARPGGRIESVRLDLISADAEFGFTSEGDE